VLRALQIRDYAIIDELELEFAAGFNVLTGETGAGKSIIMQALDLVCGGRASPDAIRAGADEAVIEAVFDLTPEEARTLADLGISAGEDLQIRRVLHRGGKGRVHVNGAPASVALLGQLGAQLIHVYGQHEQALLLRPESHLELLDTYAGHAERVVEMAERFATLHERLQRLERLRAGREDAQQRAELLRFQLQELEAADFGEGEDESLRREKDVLAHAEKLLQIYRQGEEALESGDAALATGLGRVVAQVREAARIDPAVTETLDLLDGALAQVQEAAARLRACADDVTFDAERREAVEERWALLQRLVRKHGGSLASLRQARSDLAEELRNLDGGGLDLGTLEREVTAAAEAAWKCAAGLSATRRSKARQLEKGIAKELASLGMQGGVFSVVFEGPQPDGRWAEADPLSPATEGPRLGASGADRLEFHFSANPGEPARALVRIASGGELSRIMLALKVLTAGRGEVATLVFDEVDTGIGGTIADAVGKRLGRLGEDRQVLCITHLPQIAAAAEHHFVVEKRARQGRTVSAARQLGREERIAELSRMLGGADDAEAARYARRLVSTRRPA